MPLKQNQIQLSTEIRISIPGAYSADLENVLQYSAFENKTRNIVYILCCLDAKLLKASVIWLLKLNTEDTDVNTE